MKEIESVDIDLSKFVVVLESIMQEVETEVTLKEEAELARMKEVIKNMSIVGTMLLYIGSCYFAASRI